MNLGPLKCGCWKVNLGPLECGCLETNLGPLECGYSEMNLGPLECGCSEMNLGPLDCGRWQINLEPQTFFFNFYFYLFETGSFYVVLLSLIFIYGRSWPWIHRHSTGFASWMIELNIHMTTPCLLYSWIQSTHRTSTRLGLSIIHCGTGMEGNLMRPNLFLSS